MSNKKFISYFHMLYTGLKGTAGAYMAALLVLLSAFAATSAEKTPTTDANRQALPMKAAVKKVPETTKKLQDSSTQPSVASTQLNVASTQPKVASIVILNNTGLPDSDIYFRLNNTATDSTCYEAQLDMNAMYQWYGGTANKPAVQITNAHYQPQWGAGTTPGTAISLADMRGYVASKATAASPTPTNINTYWNTQTYSALVPNNPDKSVEVGVFPTISLGLWGAQSEIINSIGCKYAGQMAIYVSDKAATDFTAYKNTTCGSYQPYVLLEGSIFPSDQADQNSITFNYTGPANAYNPSSINKPVNVNKTFPKNASNFDLSFVDQFSMGANFELWGLNGNSPYGVMPATAYQSGQALQMPKDCFAPFSSNTSLANFEYSTPTIPNHTFYNFPAMQYKVTDSNCASPTTYTAWINELVGLTKTQTKAPVLKVRSYPTPNNPRNLFVGGGTFPAFGEQPYIQALYYNFAAYFVDLSVTRAGGWNTILDNYQTDTGPNSDALPAGLVPPTGLTPQKYMIMLGKFSSGSPIQPLVNKGDNPPFGYNYPVAYNSNGGDGPLSVQFDTNQLGSTISMNMTGLNPTPPCTTDIQTTGLAGGTNTSCPTSLGNVLFTDQFVPVHGSCNIVTADTNGLLGINFSMTQDNFTLSEFDLAAGLTTSANGELQVSLVQVTPTNGLNLLNKIVLTLPSTTSGVGLASEVFDRTPPTAFGNMPLTINWKTGICKFNTTILSAKYYLPSTVGGWSTQPIDPLSPSWQTWQTNLNLVNNSVASKTLGGYRIFLKGTNMTVALSSGNPSGSATAPVIVPMINTSPSSTYNYFVYKGNNTNTLEDVSKLNCTNNSYLACTIKATPTDTPTTTDLHLLAVAIDAPTENLNKYIANSNPKYRFFRYETSAWTEATKAATDDPTNPWPSTPNSSGNTTQGIANDVSGRIAGDAVTAFSFGIVNSQKLGSAFTGLTWPGTDAINFPALSTKIGDLTTCQYFYLMNLQTSNNGTLPVGANLNNDLSMIRYDPYNDVGMNKLMSNGYFFGFTDRIGGLFNPNPTFNMDSGTNTALLGFVPGSPSTTQPVIVITLHQIDQVPSTTTIMHDVNQSGSTDSEDLSLVLLAIGVCPPAPADCPEDVNNDGEVEHTDVGLVLLHFGL